MTSKNLTSKEIIFIHEIIEEKFVLPKGHIKEGELETLIVKSEGIPFSGKEHDLFKQAAIIFEGITRIHIFTDGNKRTALESTRQFLNRNERVLIIPLSGTNFMYKIARNKTLNTDKVVSEISDWLQTHSARVDQWYKISGLLLLYLSLPVTLVNFFSKIKLNKVSQWILYRYLVNEDPKVADFMVSIYEKQLGLFQQSAEEHEKKSQNN